jgi:DNA-binding NtrC family response regulator
MLNAHHWPGNVRELRNAVERMVVLSRGDRITLRDVPPEIREGKVMASRGASTSAAGVPPLSIDEAEKNLIVRALRNTGGNRTKAAEQLGISRRTLHRKLHEYNLSNAGDQTN